MRRQALVKSLLLQAGVLGALFLLQFVLPPYHHSSVSKIMVLGAYAVGYNFLLGYTGLMSLGHAMFFAAGMYATGLGIYYWELAPTLGVAFGGLTALALSGVFGMFALRTTGVAFLIVTLMFGQTLFLSILYFDEFTFGQDGFTLSKYLPPLVLGGQEFAYADPGVRYNIGLLLLGAYLLLTTGIMLSPIGRVLIAIRENEARTQLLGYNVFAYKWFALTLSGTLSGLAGSVHGVLFSYVGVTFAEIHHSIDPLLWTLLGGTGTVIGPLAGTGIMFYLIDYTSSFTDQYRFVVGAILILIIIWFPLGLVGTLRKRWLTWLP
jgi:branched-chain amino acid transport system permease protein